MLRPNAFYCLFLLTGFVPFDVCSSDPASLSKKVLIVHDELPHITSHNVTWDGEIAYTPSDQPATDALYPSISLHETEVYLNHKFTNGGDKTVLFGLKFFDDRNGLLFMQDRGAWLKEHGNGEVVYIMPGHAASDFENENISQMILNAINWRP